MAILQQHADAIVRDAPPRQVHKEYPKYMTHPAYEPGTIGQEVRSPAGFSYHVGGTPIRYPPMLVKDADQEAYYVSQGYVSQGTSDPVAFAAAVAAMPPPPDDYRPQEYPKWVGGSLVNSREEEAAAAKNRRAQLGIEEDDEDPVPTAPPMPSQAPAETPPTEAPPPEAPPPEALEQPPALIPAQAPVAEASAESNARIDSLEASVAEIKQMFVEFMAARDPTRKASGASPEPEAEPPPAAPEPAPLDPAAPEPATPEPAPPEPTAPEPETPPVPVAAKADAAHRPVRKPRRVSRRKQEADRNADNARRKVQAIMHPASPN